MGGRDNEAVHRGDVLFRPTMRRLALRSTNPSTALGSVFATCARDWVTVRGVVTSDIAGKHESTRVALDVEAKYNPIKSLTLFVRPDITAADEFTAGRFSASMPRGAPLPAVSQYTAGGGISTFRFSVGAAYRLNRSGLRERARRPSGCKTMPPTARSRRTSRRTFTARLPFINFHAITLSSKS
jgi:hypothetical protein